MNNTTFRQFSVAVTAVAQPITITAAVTPSGDPPVEYPFNAWLFENDSATETIYIRFAEPGVAVPVAVDDTANTDMNQMRLLPAQAKRIDAWMNTYLSVVATGNANLRVEVAGGSR